jgi:hypothetical protein
MGHASDQAALNAPSAWTTVSPVSNRPPLGGTRTSDAATHEHGTARHLLILVITLYARSGRRVRGFLAYDSNSKFTGDAESRIQRRGKMTDPIVGSISGVIGALVGGATSLAGSITVGRMQFARDARVRIFREIISKITERTLLNFMAAQESDQRFSDYEASIAELVGFQKSAMGRELWIHAARS